MRQRTVMEMFDVMENKELNNEMKEIVENEIISENVNISGIKEVINDSNGIVEVKYDNGEIYRTWKVKFILPKITKFLKEIHPDSLIVRGLTDIVVFDKKTDDITPVEIQKTPIHGGSKKFSHTEFEKEIRKQLEENIEMYEKCWQFFDSEYLRFLQTENVGKNTSVDLTWLVRLMKKKKLKVFVIKYDGVVKELATKDFDFLKNISQTCSLEYESDERVLERNKLKIKRNVLFEYNFTQEEITQFENEFDYLDIDEKEKTNGIMKYCMKSSNKRCKLYGNILHSISELSTINNVLSCTLNGNSLTWCGVTVGLFYQNEYDGRNKYARIQFIDKFNVAQYFPGYLRNKEMWDYCKMKQRVFTIPEFRGIIEGREHCLKLIKQQSKSLLDYN